MRDGVAATEAGAIQGARDGRSWGWRGVPYARPPVGPLRFRPPEPAEAWSGCRDGSRFGPAAPQRLARLGGRPEWLGAGLGEDCLYLNIWSPAGEPRPRPVMVWVHGGGFVSGSGALYRGAPLASLGDIVVVTINYRLGVFGFVNFHDATGDAGIGRNLGLQDVVAALGWVRRNIAAFGGDPDRVTLAGESAGSIIVSLLMLTRAAPLFHQAILQSGVFNLVHSRAMSTRIAAGYGERLAGSPASLEALQAVPAEQLLAVQGEMAAVLRGTSAAAPWFDDDLLPESYDAARSRPVRPIPLLVGANRDEIALFTSLPGPQILRTRRADILELLDRDLGAPAAKRVRTTYPPTGASDRALGSDANFVMPTLHLAERHAASGSPTWAYRFDYAHPWLGACHALELFFLWPFPGLLAMLMRGGWLTGLRSGLSERMRAAWTSFVRTGSPGDDWPRYELPTRRTKLFALQDRIVADPMAGRREAWEGRDMQPGR